VPAYEIRPLTELDLAEVSAFLDRSMVALFGRQGPPGEEAPSHPVDVAPGTVHRWLLDEGNPARSEGIPPAEIIRSGTGAVVGMITYHAQVYRLGDRRLLGLGAGNFHVDPSARMQGFFLLRRYLNNPKADFCFATSCNANSGPLWVKCGAGQVPNSDREYLYVNRIGPVAQELALRKGLPNSLAASLRLVGPVAKLIIGPRRPRNRLTVQRSDDWDQLAAIAERNRDPARLTHERSAGVLRNKFEALAKQGISSGTSQGIYLFSSPNGREGWFAIRETPRGRLGQIRGANLLDLSWPRTEMTFHDVLPAMIEVIGRRVDLLSIRDRVCFGLRPGLLGLRQRTLPAPEAFVVTNARSGLPPSAELAQVADFSPAADRF
jgi:hypothetical protein